MRPKHCGIWACFGASRCLRRCRRGGIRSSTDIQTAKRPLKYGSGGRHALRVAHDDDAANQWLMPVTQRNDILAAEATIGWAGCVNTGTPNVP